MTLNLVERSFQPGDDARSAQREPHAATHQTIGRKHLDQAQKDARRGDGSKTGENEFKNFKCQSKEDLS
jgi:hypothetical protein